MDAHDAERMMGTAWDRSGAAVVDAVLISRSTRRVLSAQGLGTNATPPAARYRQRFTRRPSMKQSFEAGILTGSESIEVAIAGIFVAPIPSQQDIDDALERLNAVLPPTWSHGNPVDIIGDAPGQRYADALGILFEDPTVDAIVALNCPTGIASSTEAAGAVAAAVQTRPHLPVIASWVGNSPSAEEARRLLEGG